MKENNKGHRARVREKFLLSFGNELHDYEILEILLFNAITRADTKSIAKDLLKKFGNISAIIDADVNLLKEIKGVGDSAIMSIKIIKEILNRIMREKTKNNTEINSFEDIISYINLNLRNLTFEVFRVFYLDNNYNIVGDLTLSQEGSNEVSININQIIKKSLILNSQNLILSHNHPANSSEPSSEDIKTTAKIISTLSILNINILDHIIIAKDGYYSFKESGLI